MFRKKALDKRRRFEELSTPHLDALYATALRLTRNPNEAEDLVQDTCLKAFRFLDKYQAGTNFKAWIFKIQTNLFINRYRKNQRKQTFQRTVEADGHYSRLFGQGPARKALKAEDDILDHLMNDDIREALDELPPDFRLAVLLCDVEEFSYKEIAEIMDCPVGTVMSRLYRARRLLQSYLLQHAVDRGFVAAAPTTPVTPDNTPREGEAAGASVTDLASYRKKLS